MSDWRDWGPSTTEVPPAIKAPWYKRHTRPSTRGLGRAAIPFIPPKDDSTTNNNGTTKDLVKTSNPTNYVEEVQKTKADFSIEERVAFMALTGTEILEISRNFNMSNNSLSLNKNVLDSTVVINAASPIELIKTQNSNTDYIAKSSSTVENTTVVIAPATGTTTVTAPATTVSTAPAQPATTTTNAATVTNTNQVKVEVQTPTTVVTQTPTPPQKLISFTPTSAKKGAKITVTHEKCNVSSRTVKVGIVTAATTSMTSKTFLLTVPTSASLVVGQQYEISITIGGVTVKAPGTLTILA
jgi:hypothetical protein